MTPDTHVGQLVVEQHKDGTITIVLQRNSDVGDHRVYVSGIVTARLAPGVACRS